MKIEAALVLGLLVLAGCAGQIPPADTSRITPPPAAWMTKPVALPDIPDCSKASEPIKCRAAYDARAREQYADTAERHGALQGWVRKLLAKTK